MADGWGDPVSIPWWGLPQLLPYMIVTLHTQGDRIIVGDVQESVHYIKYKSQENQVRARLTRVR